MEEVEVKIEPGSKARDSVGAVKVILEKDKKQVFDLDFVQGPINFDSLSPIQKMQLTSFSQANAREYLLKFHIEDIQLLTLTYTVLEKIMPIYVKDKSNSPSG